MDFKLHYWPAIVSGWFISTILISYIIAVTTGSVHPILPYISELGIWPPSNVIFGQMLNIGAILMAVGLYIRYKQIDFVIKTRTTKLHKRWNEIELYLGFITSLGISLVANFPADLKGYRFIAGVHFIGAFLSFGIGGLYLLIQTKITFDLQPYYDCYPKVAVSKSIQYLRFVLTIFFGISYVVASVYLFAFLKVHNLDKTLYSTDHPAYTYHLVSAIAEWVMAIILFCYTLTATNEFKYMSFKEICFDNFVDNKKK